MLEWYVISQQLFEVACASLGYLTASLGKQVVRVRCLGIGELSRDALRLLEFRFQFGGNLVLLFIWKCGNESQRLT